VAAASTAPAVPPEMMDIIGGVGVWWLGGAMMRLEIARSLEFGRKYQLSALIVVERLIGKFMTYLGIRRSVSYVMRLRFES
jgi:hypothetical protein